MTKLANRSDITLNYPAMFTTFWECLLAILCVCALTDSTGLVHYTRSYIARLVLVDSFLFAVLYFSLWSHSLVNNRTLSENSLLSFLGNSFSVLTDVIACAHVCLNLI